MLKFDQFVRPFLTQNGDPFGKTGIIDVPLPKVLNRVAPQVKNAFGASPALPRQAPWPAPFHVP